MFVLLRASLALAAPPAELAVRRLVESQDEVPHRIDRREMPGHEHHHAKLDTWVIRCIRFQSQVLNHRSQRLRRNPVGVQSGQRPLFAPFQVLRAPDRRRTSGCSRGGGLLVVWNFPFVCCHDLIITVGAKHRCRKQKRIFQLGLGCHAWSVVRLLRAITHDCSLCSFDLALCRAT